MFVEKSNFTGDHVEVPIPRPSTIPENFNVSLLPVDVSSITVNALHALPFQSSPIKLVPPVVAVPT